MKPRQYKRNAPFLTGATTPKAEATQIKGSGWIYTQNLRDRQGSDQRRHRGRSGTMGSYFNQHPSKLKGYIQYTPLQMNQRGNFLPCYRSRNWHRWGGESLQPKAETLSLIRVCFRKHLRFTPGSVSDRGSLIPLYG